MAAKHGCLFTLVILFCFAKNASSFSYLGETMAIARQAGSIAAPSFMQLFSCVWETEVINCAKERARKILDSWDLDLGEERRNWAEQADNEAKALGARSSSISSEPPSKLGTDVETGITALTEVLQTTVSNTMARKKSGSGGETITIMTGSGDDHKKKKMKIKKGKPQKIQIVHPHASKPQGRLSLEPWNLGSEVSDAVASLVNPKSMVSSRSLGVDDQTSSDGEEDTGRELGESRGKKKKKKKAILKLLLLGAVLKAKIGLLLQILSAKLQVKFFLIALAGLLINVARFWIDLKKGGAPQKVIYYEHAQHQHHYEHEDEHGWGGGSGTGGGWSRTFRPDEQESTNIYPIEADPSYNSQEGTDYKSPYHGWYPNQERKI